MPFTATVKQSVQVGGISIDKSKDYTANARKSLDESVADGQTDKQLTFELDVSATVAFYLVSDQAVTVETNSGSTPTDTITLVANVPYVWHSDSYDSFLLTADVTAVFITNASGSAAQIKIEAVYDPTP